METRKIRVRGEFLADPKLPMGAKVLYVALLYLSTGAGRCQPTKRQLRQLTGIRSPSSLDHYLNVLEHAGWLRTEPLPRQRRSYIPHDPYHEARLQRLAVVKRNLAAAPHLGEALLREIVTELVDSSNILFNARPAYLANPLSDQPLEYDILCCGRVALEFNGPQHYGPTEKYPDPDEARRQRSRDLMKQALSAQHGIHLVVIVPEDLSFEKVSHKLHGLVPLREIDPEDPVVAHLRKAARDYRTTVAGRSLRPARPRDNI
ncbi:MAG: hypothetical protein QME93_04110 [Bacillota bacterium]|nr:hypothetical protein [Bacillota bacterium]MDI7249236.1 hypothetical protein [Bacillota bacterium]